MILKRNTSNKSKRVMYKGKIIILKTNTQLLSNGVVEEIPKVKEKVVKKEEKVVKKRTYKKKEVPKIETTDDEDTKGE